MKIKTLIGSNEHCPRRENNTKISFRRHDGEIIDYQRILGLFDSQKKMVARADYYFFGSSRRFDCLY